MKFIIFLIAMCLIAAFCSCTKGEIGERKYTFDRYELRIDWLSLDSTKCIKCPAYVQVFDSIWKPETKLAFDTLSDKYYIDCNMLDVLQHLYYRKNGKKIK